MQTANFAVITSENTFSFQTVYQYRFSVNSFHATVFAALIRSCLTLAIVSNRYPYVTGSSIIALKYKDGVIMASDTGG